MLRGGLSLPAYCLLLASLHPIYAALESGLQRHADRPELAAIHAPSLWREPALAEDLLQLHGTGWREALVPPPQALAYAAHLHELAEQAPALLAAHAYVRYLGDLSGGQALRRIVATSLGLADGTGTRFYDFGLPAQTAALAGELRAGLDRIEADEATRAAIVNEAERAFARHERLFGELEAARLALSP
ncbi:biliverdin-producing heme oxygenase [Piscinibacter aquaticus]|uniref:Biliverdin-producing heme oxygenase n=1 Tax=Piscinibacter aquaticus TaxID=392597 RepID=A0A5C6U6M9_9BURK|nr:biliverdin-producing heme oxygenase [Piscinibacter aquaticus]